MAGSERSDKVGTTGASLVEGNNINKSLSVLGRCIKALCDASKGGGDEGGAKEEGGDGKKKKKSTA